MSEWHLVAELLVLGLIVGFLAGLMGIGGGAIVGPVLTMIFSARGMSADLAVKMAIATSMAVIVLTSLSSVRAHHQRGAVRWDIFAGMAPGVITGGLIGSVGIFALVKGNTLAVLFALFIGFSVMQIWRRQDSVGHKPMPGFGGKFMAGSAMGLLAGLIGAGGAFVSMPFMLAHDVALINAVATSSALGFVVAVVNSGGFALGGASHPGLPPWSLGYVWLPGLAVVALSSVCTAPLGAKLAHALPVNVLKRLLCGVLLSLAAYMLFKGLRG